jgi:hypothetical protein
MKKLSLTIFAIFLFMIFHSTAFASDYFSSLTNTAPIMYNGALMGIYSDLANGANDYPIPLTNPSGSSSNMLDGTYGHIYKGTYPDISNPTEPPGLPIGNHGWSFAQYGFGTFPLLPPDAVSGNYFLLISTVTLDGNWSLLHINDNIIFPFSYDETTLTVTNISNTPPIPPSCTDGIQNQGETGIDVGGPCFYVSLNWPTDVSQVPDFAQWTVAYYGNDTAINTATMQKGVMWSDNKTLLDSCLNYPNSTATYASCFALADPVHIDFGADLYISSPTHSEFIDKIGTMSPAQTYYARAVLYSVNDTSLNRETLLSYGSDISFTIDNTVGTAGASNLCSSIDIGCILKAVINWAFVPTQASLTQFSNLGTFLSSKAPFGYANEIYTEMTTITYNADQTPTVIIPQVQFIDDDIFTPMKNGLEWILWFSFGFYLFKRFKDIDI